MARRPLIGITTYVEPASWGHWQLEAALVPYDYVRAVEKAGGRAVLVPPDDEGIEELLDALDGLIFSGGNDLTPESYGADADPSADAVASYARLSKMAAATLRNWQQLKRNDLAELNAALSEAGAKPIAP